MGRAVRKVWRKWALEKVRSKREAWGSRREDSSLARSSTAGTTTKAPCGSLLLLRR